MALILPTQVRVNLHAVSKLSFAQVLDFEHFDEAPADELARFVRIFVLILPAKALRLLERRVFVLRQQNADALFSL